MGTIRIISNKNAIAVPKIFCVGRNYPEHAREMKAEVPTTPVIFLKPATAILGDGQEIVFPSMAREMHHEVEMVVLIGRGGRNILEPDVDKHISGYGVGLDMTLRDVQSAAKAKGLPWTVAKGFDGSAPVSEFIPAATAGPHPDFKLRCSVNGVVRQEGDTSEMIFPVGKLVGYISSIFTLEPGDLIFTGTPEGVGPVKPGDTIAAELVGHTSLHARVVAAP